MKLYWNIVCPFVQRAWITAKEKNIPVELVPISLNEEVPDWYKAINPRETVPALQLADGRVVLESMYIAKYFDEAFEPKNSLMTNDATIRLRINDFIDGLGPFIGSLYTFLRATGDDAAGARENTTKALKEIEGKLTQISEGPFVFGNTFTMADIALVPFLDRFRSTLVAYRNFSIFEGAPRLQRLLEAALLRPSVWSTKLTAAQYIEAYSSYGRTTPAPQKWTISVAKNSPAQAAIEVYLAMLKGATKDAVTVTAVNGETTTIRLPTGETLTERGTTPPVAILEYLSETFGASQVTDAFDRSRGRLSVDIGTSLVSAEDAATASGQLGKLVKGPYIFGAEPTVYDAALAALVAVAQRQEATATALNPPLRALLQAATSSAAIKAILLP